MSVLPKELLLFSQMFGGLSLTVSNDGPSMKFSKVLYMKSVLVITLLTMLSIMSLWVEYDAYRSSTPLRMLHSTNVVAVSLDIVLLNLMSLAVYVSNLTRYPSFVDLCYSLDRVDRCLRLTLKSPRIKVALLSLYITSLIVYAETTLMSAVGWKGLWHLFDLLHYYVQGALFLQFTYITDSFTSRFRVINKMMEKEVVGQSERRIIPYSRNVQAPGRIITNCLPTII